jgi:hypothetical protein
VQHRRVAYDHAAVIAAVERSQHPVASFIIDYQRGNRTIEGMVVAANAPAYEQVGRRVIDAVR